jgi:hypothetical protein
VHPRKQNGPEEVRGLHSLENAQIDASSVLIVVLTVSTIIIFIIIFNIIFIIRFFSVRQRTPRT